jgi:TolB-like protein/DNA-binding winged helix-turn-helix (wHTH) protein/Tfp pilus assembly protein PilF
MGAETQKSDRYRFGVFELNAETGELLKHGVRVKLQDQPFRVLTLLVERSGELVAREELRQQVWGQDTFVDFDHSLNISVNKLREALGDSASNPRFIETVPKRGYRFLAPVQTERRPETQEAPTRPPSDGAAGQIGSPLPAIQQQSIATRPAWKWAIAGILGVIVLAAVALISGRHETAKPPHRVMLAVLPFENLSPGEHEVFVAGLHDELIAQLGRLHPSELGVIARTSVLQYERAPKPVREIGQELNVDYVLEGTVRPVDEHFRITANLIKVSDQTQMWVETYEPTMGDMLSMQEDVARRVAEAVAVEFLPEARRELQLGATSNAGAYEAYLRGRFFWYQETRPSLEAAIANFRQAIELDPQYAPAYAGLADAYGVLGGYGFVPADQAFPKSKDAALKALALNPNSSGAYNSLAFISFYYDWDWPGAEHQFRKAIELNPNNQDAHEFLASFFHAMGRLDEAESENRIALQQDPLNAWLYDDKGWMLLSRRHPEQAMVSFQRAIELNPNFPAAHLSLAVACDRVGQFPRALAEGRSAGWRSNPSAGGSRFDTGILRRSGGRRGDHRQAAEEADCRACFAL